MGSHVFTIDGMTFISGLFWYPLAGVGPSERSQEIKSLAKEQDFDLFVVRSTSTYYVGFAHSDGQARMGVASAAAVVSKTLEMESASREFIFVSPLPDGYWMYVAQRDGIILPDGDKFFATEDAAKSRLLEDISLGDWSLIIAPTIWGVTDSVEREFADLIPDTGKGKRQIHKWWRLSPVNPYDSVFAHGKHILVVFVLLVVGMGGWAYYQKKLDMQAIEEAKRLANISKPPPPPPEHPWKKQPLALEFVDACTTAVSSIKLFPGNWDLSGIKCADGAIQASWKARDFGWITHIKEIIPDVVISGGGKVASLSVPLKALTIGKDEPVMLGRQRMLDMYSASQRYGYQLEITPVPAPAKPLPGQENNVPIIDWGEMNWNVKGVSNPRMVAETLDAPGFRIRTMDSAWVGGVLIWNLEGTQYVQP